MKAFNIILLVVFLTLVQAVKSNAWDSTAAKYYPLNVGNVYVFYKYELRLGCFPQTFQQMNRVYISGLETKPNGKQYYRFNGWWNDQEFRANKFLDLQRIDSNSMNVYVYDSISNSELLVDSLLANLGNRFDCNRLTSVMPNGIYDFIYQDIFLGDVRNIKSLQCGPALISHHYKLVEGIGFSVITGCELGAGTGYFLKGCVINGVVSGDTTFINASDFLPLKVGNVWSYNWIYYGSPSAGGRVNVHVERDTMIYSRKYYLCNSTHSYLSQWLRIDSSTGNLYKYSPFGGCSYHHGEVLLDSLFSKKGDSTNFCSSVRRLCTDTGYVQLFGQLFQNISFGEVFVLTATTRKYAKNIGQYYISDGDPFPTVYTLRGCYINGILYGDTTLTSIPQEVNYVPFEFSLLQNYPNPFNPVTNIRYDLPQDNFVTIKVYNVLGKEVLTLVNEYKQAGRYLVSFNAANFSSGIYFYTIQAGGYEHTRRMTLLK